MISHRPAPAQDVAPSARPAAGLLPSGRVAEAHRRASERLADQQRRFGVARWVLLGVVVAGTWTASPAPGFSARHLAVSVALAVFAASLLYGLPQSRLPRRRTGPAALAELAVMGAAALALAAAQPQAGAEVAVAATAFSASLRLSGRWLAAIVVPVTAGLAAIFSATRGMTAEDVVASVLFCVVLAFVGILVRQARAGQERTEVLLARLEDARDSEVAAAAMAERARIAREIHDVLAHSLSGLAIQLEGARKLAAREGAGVELRGVVDRSATLAKDGLADARRAVGALRTDGIASVEQLPALVAHYRDDLGLPVRLSVEGVARVLPPEVSVALYRAAGEGLTNVVRHAPGAPTSVTLRWEPDEVRLAVDNGPGPAPSVAPPGQGWGVAGMRERVAHVGGRLVAGPAGDGWQLCVTVPA